jgi:glutaminyl-peptide cyclotransferase
VRRTDRPYALAVSDGQGSTDKTIRGLAWLVVAQVLVIGVVLFWALLGFPLPDAITGAGAANPPAASRSNVAGAKTAAAAAAAAESAPRATVDRFDGPNAFALLREEVNRYGWRYAGSPALRRLAVRLRDLLPNGHFESIPGHPKLRNVVGTIPGHGKAILLGAHYDVESHPPGFVGANDGAAGTAAAVWLARALAKAPRTHTDRPIRIVLFDGEEEPPDCLQDSRFIQCALRGSKAYAKSHAAEIQNFVLLDYIAQKQNLVFKREGNSNRDLWAQMRKAAADVGVGALFPDADAPVSIIDDHYPFLQRGVPSIDLIDFDYPPRDGLGDTLDKVSERSLDAVGEAVYLYVSRQRRTA